MIPPVVTSFLLTMAISFLIGIGLREYYEDEKKEDTFGTVRTFVFIGVLGFVLFQLPGFGSTAFLAGLLALCFFLLIYYWHKLFVRRSPGMIGVLLGLIVYTVGPLSVSQPTWYVVLLAISTLLMLHSKGRIRQFTDRLETGEVVTACKFLAIAAVVLPLIPAAPEVTTSLGKVLSYLPVTPRQIWLAVVITTGISYLGYVLQTYLYPRRGLMLAGIVGGIYSSTVTVLVLAKKSKVTPDLVQPAARGILLAVSMMYLRILVLVAIFQFRLALSIGPALALLSLGAAGYSFWLRGWKPRVVETTAAEGHAAADATVHKNPLELNSALLFAVLFAVVSLVTKYTLAYFSELGLRMLSFVVGFSDITPFVVSLLQGSYGIGDTQILQAIVIASASNNLLKLGYAYLFGSRQTAHHVAPGMIGLAAASIIYAIVAL
jgi:uncharacterized membrane protein (DUF4010 family)